MTRKSQNNTEMHSLKDWFNNCAPNSAFLLIKYITKSIYGLFLRSLVFDHIFKRIHSITHRIICPYVFMYAYLVVSYLILGNFFLTPLIVVFNKPQIAFLRYECPNQIFSPGAWFASSIVGPIYPMGPPLPPQHCRPMRSTSSSSDLFFRT